MKNKYIIWGTGARAMNNFINYKKMDISQKTEIAAFVDNNPEKWNSTICGIPILPPDDIFKIKWDYITIWSTFKNEIASQITGSYGIPESKIKNLFSLYYDQLFEKYRGSGDAEISRFLSSISGSKQEKLEIFFFEPQMPYRNYKAYYDDGKDLYFVMFEGKRMYLKRNYKFIDIDGQKYTGDFWYEQDMNSPHRYEMGNVTVQENDILVDAGACEGNFTLHNIDKISKGYIIECNPDWIEALKCTFEPYKDKIEICPKFVSSKNDGSNITIDRLTDGKANFIKIDVEGSECDALLGSRATFAASEDIRCAVCSYHRSGDEQKIKEILKNYGVSTSVSDGYMLFICDDEVLKNPELRRGIVRGHK